MVAWRLRLPGLERREALLAAGAMALTALLALAGVHKLGTAGLLAPVALAALAIMLSRPLLAVCVVVGLTVLCEGPTFGILTFTSHLYTDAYKYVTLLDLLVAIAVVAVALDLLRNRRPVLLPRPLRFPLALLALAMVAGAVVGHANGGGSVRYVLVSEHVLAYLLALPLAVANLRLDRAQLKRLLGALAVLAIVKSGLGLVEVVGHYGAAVEGTATLTYYEPAANWLIMIAVLSVVAALLARAKAPLWLLLSSPALAACLLLSYRRSFWIAAVLALALVALLGTSSTGRRVLLQALVAVALAIWLLGSINFQSQLPIVKRAESLTPSKLEANLEDRYRLDERANVLGEIRAHPLTGLGMTIPWAATVRPLPVEHEEGRQYVHFAALWFWLKLGILGLLAYVAIILGSMALAWQAWRATREPLLRAFALASLAAIAGLVAIDTTVSDTGVDPRFTVLFATQLGILALLVRFAREEERDGDHAAALGAGQPG
ncbi:MAG TPA: O-antigen ligase family protein [Solirubrobacteraceae bacterium]|jgi:O-antigen ligase|nr:O-antigen ligase family protein [Solirubrobacteraceae bacterium]